MREYELTYIIRPDADEEGVAAIAARVEQVLTSNGGRVLKTDTWGKRRLAYAINRYTEGYYILLRAELNDKAIREIERFLKISEDVFRHLLVRVEPTTEAEEPAPLEEAAPAAEPAEAEAPAEAAEAEEAVETEEPEEPAETT